eukprot:CAMPEP_0113485608 /NCGR_PEP_ID=MMETSP0014_2-20120614/24571_1 /TAXON_ID=2857 /ORGANISM="Nitzschia sp." /LENGTH=433 /DNA_ID=CAMNT_0000379259 /DNA_START=1 /DNA_END=1302 /DNA_ORIENTATION=+ /assembly_acc=CAM_ASM_000159
MRHQQQHTVSDSQDRARSVGQYAKADSGTRRNRRTETSASAIIKTKSSITPVTVTSMNIVMLSLSFCCLVCMLGHTTASPSSLSSSCSPPFSRVMDITTTSSRYTSRSSSSSSSSSSSTRAAASAAEPGHRHFPSTSTTKAALRLLLVGQQQLRGGETSSLSEEVENDDDDNMPTLMRKIRNIVRNIMDVTEKKSPAMNNFFRSSFRTLEKLTGLKLLPRVSSSSSKTESKSKKKKNKTKKSKSKKEKKNVEEEQEGESKSKLTKPKVKAQAVTSATKEHLTSSFTTSNPNHRIQKELKEFIKHPPDNLSVQVGKNIRIWIITIKGAKGSIYDGETFKLRVSFPKEYPTVPPSVYFLKGHIPKHEHIYTNGDICLSLLGKDWRPIMTAQSIAVSIQSILSSATKKTLPMDNAQHANNKPGEYQKDWVYHDDQC